MPAKVFSGGVSVYVCVGVYAPPVLAHTWDLDGILNLLRKQISTKVSV